jgi:hypothetical protein
MIRIAAFCLTAILMQDLAAESRAQGRCVDDPSYSDAPKITVIGGALFATFDNQTSVEKNVPKLCGGIAQILSNFYRTAIVATGSLVVGFRKYVSPPPATYSTFSATNPLAPLPLALLTT